jgi:hypothetical protein
VACESTRSRILAAGELHEVGFFDTWPLHDDVGYGVGAWGVYPFFEQHFVVVSDIVLGLFVFHAHIEDHVVDAHVDVLAGEISNTVNATSQGSLPVAILGSDVFDVLDVDVTTLAFGLGGGTPVHRAGGHPEDVDDDGFTDPVSHYAIPESGIAIGDAQACVSGEFLDATSFEGCDDIHAVAGQGPRRGLGFELLLLGPLLWLRGGRRRAA